VSERSAYSLERLFTSGGIMVRCDIILDRFHHNYKIATAFTFISVNIMADVKSCVYIFFTTGNIETRCKTYSIFPFTSDIFSTDVKSLLIGQICSSDWLFFCSCQKEMN
jgi:hypothetical protein